MAPPDPIDPEPLPVQFLEDREDDDPISARLQFRGGTALDVTILKEDLELLVAKAGDGHDTFEELHTEVGVAMVKPSALVAVEVL